MKLLANLLKQIINMWKVIRSVPGHHCHHHRYTADCRGAPRGRIPKKKKVQKWLLECAKRQEVDLAHLQYNGIRKSIMYVKQLIDFYVRPPYRRAPIQKIHCTRMVWALLCSQQFFFPAHIFLNSWVTLRETCRRKKGKYVPWYMTSRVCQNSRFPPALLYVEM